MSGGHCTGRTAIIWLILFAAFFLYLYEYWWVARLIIEGVLVAIEVMLFAVVWFALAAIMY
jgi:hypothetical protein